MWQKITLLALILSLSGKSQEKHFILNEQFDTVVPPRLPKGWQTSLNRSPGGDFTVSASVPYSLPNAALSTNAALVQCLISPLLDLTDAVPDSLSFVERRSASHSSGFLVEASTDSGKSYPLAVSDTLKNSGTVSYIPRSFGLPGSLTGEPAVRIRWRIIGNGTGTTGTIRIDDIRIYTHPPLGVSLGPIHCTPERPAAGDSLLVTATIINTGIRPACNLRVGFYDDIDGDSIPEAAECFGSLSIDDTISPGDSVQTQCQLGNLSSGEMTVLVQTELFTGGDTLREMRSHRISVGIRPGSLIVNEIMYQPGPEGSEYIEFYNRSTETVDISGMKFNAADGTGDRPTEIHLGRGVRRIGPGEFFLVAAESSIIRKFPSLLDTARRLAVLDKSRLGLSDNGTEIILRDASGRLIDSIRYSPLWHNNALEDVIGRSLERINPELPGNERSNWSTSASHEGGTPDAPNSIFSAAVPARSSLFLAPNPFSPDGDGVEDFTLISFELPFTSAIVRLRIYDIKGRLVRLIAAGDPAGSHGNFIWDGYDDRRRRLPVGIYIVFLEAIDGLRGIGSNAKALAVVAARM